MTRRRPASEHCAAHHDRGSAAIVVLGVVAVLAALLLSIARFGGDLNDAARARTAADAAALAGVHGGRSQADALARANGAVLTRFDVVGDDVVVAVVVGSASATARATDAGDT